jgi:hypothetical protein
LFARRHRACRRVDPRAYGILHKELITSCRSLAASASDVDGDLYRYLEALVQPWLSPLVLARAEREILLELVDRCREVEREFGSRFWPLPFPLVVLLALFLSFFVFLWILGRGITAAPASTVLNALRSVSDDVWYAVTLSSDFERLCFAAVVLMVVSIAAVLRTARS